jgi:hypothetical protein
MTTPSKEKKIKVWALMFNHPEGWTFLSAHHVKWVAEDEMHKWKLKLTGCKYKVIPVKIIIKQAKQK